MLIATAILALGLVAIFGLTHTAHQRSVDAADLAAVELACQTTLNELLANQNPIAPVAAKSIDGVRHWKLEVRVGNAPRPGLATLVIYAQKFDPQGELPTGTSFQLVRWVPQSRVKQIDETPSPFSSDASPFAEFEDPFTQPSIE